MREKELFGWVHFYQISLLVCIQILTNGFKGTKGYKCIYKNLGHDNLNHHPPSGSEGLISEK